VTVVALGALPGVRSAERHGEAVVLTCTDADAALPALLAAFPAARDIEVAGGSLEEAFLELTAADETTARDDSPGRTGATR
jgi:ABC-2 type transport system ATP-binding protein